MTGFLAVPNGGVLTLFVHQHTARFYGANMTEQQRLIQLYMHGASYLHGLVQRNQLASTDADQRRLILFKLQRIEHALIRLKGGVYGDCLVCDRPIHPERRARLPYAELCQSCQSRTEQQLLDDITLFLESKHDE